MILSGAAVAKGSWTGSSGLHAVLSALARAFRRGHCEGMSKTSTYGGFERVIAQMETRRDPFRFGPGESLPPETTALAPLLLKQVGEVPEPYASSRSTFAYKVRELHEEFSGQPQLLYLHGLLIANLRRRDQPAQCAPLFLRLWAEQGHSLLQGLNPRWLVSAITTFADHGETEIQRRVGHSLSVLFSTMKLYETERLFSGAAPGQPFAGKRQKETLPLEMDPYAVSSGGLDVNMLGRIWADAEQDDLIRPLAHHLLKLLDDDPRSVFRRFRLMRDTREANNPVPDKLFAIKRIKDEGNVVSTAGLTPSPNPLWGIVSTVRAPLPQIARFAAYHLMEGAHRVSLYLDTPSPEVAEFFATEPRVRIVQCDEAYWARHASGRPDAHQNRQMRNATHAYRRSDLDWLVHLDVDEFLMAPSPLSQILLQVPDKIAVLQFRPAEMLAGDGTHFKLAPRFAGHDRALLEEIYPTFGRHLRGGYVSHLEGKPMARTGLSDVRLGLHHLITRGNPVANRAELLGGWVGHAHVPSWESFRDNLDFRLELGSYRKRREGFDLHDILSYLRDEEGEAGLHRFFGEVCADTPELRARLDRYDMLITRDLQLDARCLQVFGSLPADVAA